MKHKISTLIFMLLSLVVWAQKDGEVAISKVLIKKVDSIVSVSFDAVIAKLASNYQLRVTPVLYNDELSTFLPSIVAMGRKKAILNRRLNKSVYNATSWVVSKKRRSTSYKMDIPYETWMSTLSLNVNRTIQGCCKEEPLSSFHLVDKQLIHYDIKPTLRGEEVKPVLTELQQFDEISPFLYPASDYDKRYEIFEQQREKGALIVNFPLGHWALDVNYMDNQKTLSQVIKAITLIEADSSASLKKIIVIGHTSPEGSLARNNILAEKRAKSLQTFIGERVQYDTRLFEFINGSEDWKGYRRLVEESRMPSRDQVLNIIDNYTVLGGREIEIMKLNYGNTYRYIMKHIAPQLRTAGYIQVYYESTPDTQIERINNAIKLIKNRQYEEALSILLSITGDRQLENMIGVCYMMTDQYDLAIPYFEKAIAKGDDTATDAATNLEQIRVVQSIK